MIMSTQNDSTETPNETTEQTEESILSPNLDSNSVESLVGDTSPRRAGRGADRSFLKSVRQAWDRVPNAWAQKRTNSGGKEQETLEVLWKELPGSQLPLHKLLIYTNTAQQQGRDSISYPSTTAILVVPFVWYEEPIVIEPENTIV